MTSFSLVTLAREGRLLPTDLENVLATREDRDIMVFFRETAAPILEALWHGDFEGHHDQAKKLGRMLAEQLNMQQSLEATETMASLVGSEAACEITGYGWMAWCRWQSSQMARK